MLVPALVLAAGASSRMGRPKALLPIGGRTFLACVAETLREAGLDDVVVVTGAHHEEIAAALEAADAPLVRVVHNPQFALGQLSSLRAGLAAVDHPGVSAVLVALVDHPLVRSATVRALVDAWRATRAPIVRPRHGTRHGHPVVFDRAAFDALRAAPLDEGARAVVRRFGAAVQEVDVDDPGVYADIDTPEDHERALGRPPAEL